MTSFMVNYLKVEVIEISFFQSTIKLGFGSALALRNAIEPVAEDCSRLPPRGLLFHQRGLETPHRNRVGGKTPRGFESHLLRQKP
jgi:hypothetical protein